ncbi:MAG: hypothetical protein MUC59_14105 [Saprospiraceae bacterium]|nr:hypothetical protein [Saprospiraceae bacterium]
MPKQNRFHLTDARWLLALLSIAMVLQGCMIRGNGYSLQGISIPPDVNTYYIELFDNQAPSAIPTLPRDFTERLKDKIRTESRLKYDDEAPDVEFTGAISVSKIFSGPTRTCSTCRSRSSKTSARS